jgi:hypothetical protein
LNPTATFYFQTRLKLSLPGTTAIVSTPNQPSTLWLGVKAANQRAMQARGRPQLNEGQRVRCLLECVCGSVVGSTSWPRYFVKRSSNDIILQGRISFHRQSFSLTFFFLWSLTLVSPSSFFSYSRCNDDIFSTTSIALSATVAILLLFPRSLCFSLYTADMLLGVPEPYRLGK